MAGFTNFAIYAFSLAMIGFTALILAGVAGLILNVTARLAKRRTAEGLMLLAFAAAVVVAAAAVSLIVYIWALVAFFTGNFATFGAAVTYTIDNFTTLGSLGGLPPPWDVLGPILAVNGMLIFAITGAILVTVMMSVYRQEMKHLSPASRRREP